VEDRLLLVIVLLMIL